MLELVLELVLVLDDEVELDISVVAARLVVAADVVEPSAVEELAAALSVAAPEPVVVSEHAVAIDAIARTASAARVRNFVIMLPFRLLQRRTRGAVILALFGIELAAGSEGARSLGSLWLPPN